MLLYALIVLGGVSLSRWVTVFGVAIASVGLGLVLAVATYQGYVPLVHALFVWALFQVSYGVAVVVLDGPALKSLTKGYDSRLGPGQDRAD
ncbi:MAG: hypothetical protein U1E62_01185 [Alsobacter sp.]